MHLRAEQSRAEGEQSRAEKIYVGCADRRCSASNKTLLISRSRKFSTTGQAHHHPKAALDRKRRKVIGAALGDYSAADLCRSISGYLNSPHHMGRNDAGTVYDAIELMLRDASHIDAGLKFYEQPPAEPESSRPHGACQWHVQITMADLRAPECRACGICCCAAPG